MQQKVTNYETKSVKSESYRGNSGFNFISPFAGKGIAQKSLGRLNTFKGMMESYAARLATVQSNSSMDSADVDEYEHSVRE